MSAVRNADSLEKLCSALERNAGDIARACSDNDCSTGWLKRWMRDDPKVDAAIRDAMDTGTAVLESALIRRAVDGWDEPVFYKDEQVGTKRKFSDSNLQFALTGRKKDVYGKTVDITNTINVRHLSDEELNSKIDMLAQRLGIQLTLPDLSNEPIEAEFSEVCDLDIEDLL